MLKESKKGPFRTVLFDFHNTLATCDPWLELEIRTLPSLAITCLVELESLPPQGPGVGERATRLFRGLRQGVRESGIELSAVEGTERVLKEMHFHVPRALLEDVVAELENDCLESLEVVPGANIALARLREAGYNLGIVSSAGYPSFVEQALEILGLRTYFSEVVTSAGEGIYKSNPEIFLRAVKRLGSAPSEAVHIGDHAVYDVQTAQRAGLSAIWFVANSDRTARLHGTALEEAERAGESADAVATRLEQVPEVIRSIEQNN